MSRHPSGTVSQDNIRRVAEGSLRAGTWQFCEPFVREARVVASPAARKNGTAAAAGWSPVWPYTPVDDEFIGLMSKNRASYTMTLSLFAPFTDIEAWVRRRAIAWLRLLQGEGAADQFNFDLQRAPSGLPPHRKPFTSSR